MALTLQWHQQIVVLVMIGFPPNSSQFLGHFCPLFVQIARMDLILPNWGLILPRLPPPTWQPLFLTHPSQTPFGDTYIHKTPPIPPQNTPFPGLKLRVGKMNYCLGKIFEKWAKLSRKTVWSPNIPNLVLRQVWTLSWSDSLFALAQMDPPAPGSEAILDFWSLISNEGVLDNIAACNWLLLLSRHLLVIANQFMIFFAS